MAAAAASGMSVPPRRQFTLSDKRSGKRRSLFTPGHPVSASGQRPKSQSRQEGWRCMGTVDASCNAGLG